MVYINGRFLGKRITGVQRFAREIVTRLDKEEYKDKFIILIDNDTNCDINFKYLKVERIGKFKGNLWEQISLYRFMKKNSSDELLNLCNSSPIRLSSYITIHDIGLIKNKGYKSKLFTMWYKYMFKRSIKHAKLIFTVSKFSKNEISSYFNVDSNKIIVMYNGIEHLNNLKENESLINKYDLKNKKYYISVASNLPHKNLDKLVEYFKTHKDINLILVSNHCDYLLDNVILFKDLSSNDLYTLYKYAYAFILISSYEGFGIPPMEAIVAGCKRILLSNIFVFNEIYGDGVNYIEINNFYIPYNLKEINCTYKNEIIKKYSWEKCVNLILTNIL